MFLNNSRCEIYLYDNGNVNSFKKLLGSMISAHLKTGIYIYNM